jgi:hypothetical protein
LINGYLPLILSVMIVDSISVCQLLIGKEHGLEGTSRSSSFHASCSSLSSPFVILPSVPQPVNTVYFNMFNYLGKLASAVWRDTVRILNAGMTGQSMANEMSG